MTIRNDTPHSMHDRFKQCPLCATWFSRHDIMHSPIVKPIGMLLEEADPELNFFYFNHEIDGCGTTFVVAVDDMRPFTVSTSEDDGRDGADACRGHCIRRGDDGDCRDSCYYAPYRRLLRQLIANRAGLVD